jgi:hypothetical protein
MMKNGLGKKDEITMEVLMQREGTVVRFAL